MGLYAELGRGNVTPRVLAATGVMIIGGLAIGLGLNRASADDTKSAPQAPALPAHEAAPHFTSPSDEPHFGVPEVLPPAQLDHQFLPTPEQ